MFKKKKTKMNIWAWSEKGSIKQSNKMISFIEKV